MITVICPVYNESKHIKSVLDFCVQAKPLKKEIFFIDGSSTDDTCEIIQSYIELYDNIYLLDNPQRFVPFALNKAIVKAKGDFIIRLDAHTDYSIDYFEKIIEVFEKTDADIVGGPMRIAQGNQIQQAIGYATTTSFGIGNSSFHFEDFEGYTDSVYLGAWKRNVFDKIGLFDEVMVRNQDDEFHYRAKSKGLKIYQSPTIKLWYYPRASFVSLYKQYFQYGLYKPTVLKKINSAFSLRHIIPSLFVLYFLSILPGLIFQCYWWLLPLILYFTLATIFALKSKSGLVQMGRIIACYVILHVAYGSGFIKGFLFNPIKK